MNKIYVDVKDSKYVLTGNVETLLDDISTKSYLEYLKFEYQENTILIGFDKETKISILDDINDFGKDLDISIDYKKSVDDIADNYRRDQENFKKFSQKAKDIRNDKFSDDLELVRNFKKFKEVLENGMKNRILYDRQILSAFHMAFSQNSCNFSVPGAGKTSIVYAAYTFLNNLSEDDDRFVDKILIIGPLSSFAPWEKEYKKCFGISPISQRLSGDITTSKTDKENHLYSNNPAELTLMSHAALQNYKNDIINFLKQNKVMVVVDEAHKIKNVDGIWGNAAIEISKEASSRIVLTGTPAPRGYEDLYNLIRFIYPFNFLDIMKIHYGQLRELTNSDATIYDSRVVSFVENIKPFFIRINKKELKLPDFKEHKINVEMDNLQRKIYDFIEDNYVSHFEDHPSATAKEFLNKARLHRLKQASTNPRTLIKSLNNSIDTSEFGNDSNSTFGSLEEGIKDSKIYKDILSYEKSGIIPPKFITAKEIFLENIMPKKEKVIIWTIYIQNAYELKKYLNSFDIESELLIGRIEPDEREVIIEKFNNPKNNEFNIVIANPASVSESISLHEGCHNAIYLERDHNAANYIQSKNRIHRYGIPEDIITTYYYLVSSFSIDESVDSNLLNKEKRMEEIIDQEIPLFKRFREDDETDLLKEYLRDYAKRAK